MLRPGTDNGQSGTAIAKAGTVTALSLEDKANKNNKI